MSYVGWKDVKSALRYVEARNSFGSPALQSVSQQLKVPGTVTS